MPHKIAISITVERLMDRNDILKSLQRWLHTLPPHEGEVTTTHKTKSDHNHISLWELGVPPDEPLAPMFATSPAEPDASEEPTTEELDQAPAEPEQLDMLDQDQQPDPDQGDSDLPDNMNDFLNGI